MKKFIAMLLLFTMCIGVFVGCKGNDDNANVDLENAKTYVFNMYNGGASKGEALKLLKDKEVISSVPVDGVTYTIEWSVKVTTGAADSVKIADGNNGNKLVDIPDASEEKIEFTLTATIKAPNGESATVDFLFFVPEVEKADVTDGKVITLYNPASESYVSGKGFLYNGSKNELHMTKEKAEAIALTLVTNADGPVSFKTADGKFLYGDATHAKFVDAEGEFTKFNIEAAEGGSFIKTQGVYGSGDTAKPQYLEVHQNSLTVYGMNAEKAEIYTFEFKDAEGANGKPEFEQAAPVEVTITEALAKDDGTMVIVKGTVKTINTPWDDGFGNITVTIEDATGATLYVYRLKTKVEVGDVVTITGAVSSYNGEKQIASGATAVIEANGGNQGGTEGGNQGGTDAPAAPSVLAGVVSATEANGTKLTLTVSTVGTANNWENSKPYTEFKMDENITVTAIGTAAGNYGVNTGKYYSADPGTWRIYQSETPALTITAATGKNIVSVKITYVSQNTGVITNGTAQVESDAVITVGANSITLSVGNTSADVTNGQARITAIEVIYA